MKRHSARYAPGFDDEPVRRHDLDDLAGTWVQDDAFDQAVAAMDRADLDLQRSHRDRYEPPPREGDAAP